MSVLTREALEASPLADLHQIAAELELSGYRRLRKADLIDRLLGEGGDAAAPSSSGTSGSRRGSRSGERAPRSRDRDRDRDSARSDSSDERPARRGRADAAESREPRKRERAGANAKGEGRDAGSGRRERGGDAADAAKAPQTVEGPVTVQSSGAGFVEPKGGGEQVYVSAAQIRRLELSAGDVIGGPVRPARRSEKHPSLVRIESINGRSADEVAPPVPGRNGAPKPVAPTFPSERIALGSDSTLALIERVAPIGRGSRVVLHGGPHSGKSTAARGIAAALKASGVEVFTVLAGIRTEEESDWASFQPTAAEPIDSSPDSRAKAVERALDKARRASASGHSALIVDSIDDLPGAAVRKTLGAAQFLAGSGSLTIVVTAKAPVGGETTVIGFDQALAAAGKFPSVRVRTSSTLRPELLVEGRALKALQKAHADAVKKER